jgi:OOP family OmpA-OmpF porin
MLPESKEKGAVQDGCPDTFTLAGDRIALRARFEFVKRRTGITAWSRWIIADLAAAAIIHREWSEIRIRVHTSGTGDKDANKRLSEDRAVAIMKALVEKGLAPERLLAEGLGDADPVESPKTAAGREANERVEITIVTAGGGK